MIILVNYNIDNLHNLLMMTTNNLLNNLDDNN